MTVTQNPLAAGDVANLFRVDSTLLSGLAIRALDEPSPRAFAPLKLAKRDNGVQLVPELSGPGVLTFHAEAPTHGGGLSTMGRTGYAPRSDEFDEEGITDLLFGKGRDLVRVSLGGEAKVSLSREDGVYAFRAELPAGAHPLVQVRFLEEHAATVNLAADAEAAERRGDLGECLAKWQQLLDEYPFEETEVARAESVRARLLRQGYEETRALSGKVERAAFFRLVDLYRECRAQAVDIARRYAGSEVQAGATELVATIDESLAALEADLDRHEIQRLGAILAVLEAQGAEKLAKELRDYLSTQFGEGSD